MNLVWEAVLVTSDFRDDPTVRRDHFTRVGDSRFATGLAAVLDRAVAPPYRMARRAHLNDLLHGTFPLRHPAHPALSDVPVGLYIAAVIAYALDYTDAGIAMTLAGVAGAILAAATGLADWSVTEGRDKRLGAIHGTVNVVATLLAGASIGTYYGVSDGNWPFGLIAAALAVTLVAAYLGGHLVFDRGLMVNLAAVAATPTLDWTPVLAGADLTAGQARPVQVTPERAVIVSRSASGMLSCIDARCVHAGGPLGEGVIENGRVTCPWHFSVFELSTGAVRHGPASRPQPRLRTREVDGRIEIADPEG